MLLKEENRQPERGKDQPDFLAQAAEQKRRARPAEVTPTCDAHRAQTVQPEQQTEKSKRRGQWIGSSGNVGNRARVQRMHGPSQCRKIDDKAARSFRHAEIREEFEREKIKRDGRGEMAGNAREVIAGRVKCIGRIIQGVAESLHGPVKIRSGRIEEEKMLEALVERTGLTPESFGVYFILEEYPIEIITQSDIFGNDHKITYKQEFRIRPKTDEELQLQLESMEKDDESD